jgi:hypothetical protein
MSEPFFGWLKSRKSRSNPSYCGFSTSKIMLKEILLEGDPNQWSVAITRQTFTRILGSEKKNKGDMLALWMFYAYTARWQHVSQAKATTGYTAKGLAWTEERVRKAKRELVAMDLVQDAVSKDGDGKAVGWFIRVFHLATHTPLFPEGGKSGDKCSRMGILNAQGMVKTKDDNFFEKKAVVHFSPIEYPSESQLESYIEDNELDGLINGRIDLHGDLMRTDWRDGNGKRIRDWRAYITGLNETIINAAPNDRGR